MVARTLCQSSRHENSRGKAMAVGIRRLREPAVFSRSLTFALSRYASLEMLTRDLAADEARENQNCLVGMACIAPRRFRRGRRLENFDADPVAFERHRLRVPVLERAEAIEDLDGHGRKDPDRSRAANGIPWRIKRTVCNGKSIAQEDKILLARRCSSCDQGVRT